MKKKMKDVLASEGLIHKQAVNVSGGSIHDLLEEWFLRHFNISDVRATEWPKDHILQVRLSQAKPDLEGAIGTTSHTDFMVVFNLMIGLVYSIPEDGTRPYKMVPLLLWDATDRKISNAVNEVLSAVPRGV